MSVTKEQLIAGGIVLGVTAVTAAGVYYAKKFLSKKLDAEIEECKVEIVESTIRLENIVEDSIKTYNLDDASVNRLKELTSKLLTSLESNKDLVELEVIKGQIKLQLDSLKKIEDEVKYKVFILEFNKLLEELLK